MAATEGVLSVTVLYVAAADFFWRQRQMLTAAPANRFPIIFLNDVHPTDFDRLLQVRLSKRWAVVWLSW